MAMKWLVAAMVLLASSAFALPPGVKTSDGVACPKPASLLGMVIYTDGSNNVTVVLRDGSATGSILIPSTTVLAADYYGGMFLPFELPTSNGVYVDITTSAAADYGVAVYCR